LFADHLKRARAVLNVSASSFAAACLPDAADSNSGANICSLPGAELSLIGTGTTRDSSGSPALPADVLLKACTVAGGGFRRICLRITIDEAPPDLCSLATARSLFP
jgi:hypothetical protein